MMNILNWLTKWFQSNCNGDWEHDYGIRIETLDNPGWLVDIYLFDTELQNKNFQQIELNENDSDWMFCKVENYFFKGRGDLNKLIKILEIFKSWAEQSNST